MLQASLPACPCSQVRQGVQEALGSPDWSRWRNTERTVNAEQGGSGRWGSKGAQEHSESVRFALRRPDGAELWRSSPVLRYIPAVWAMISFIISEVPPPMVSMRTSLQARAMFVSSM